MTNSQSASTGLDPRAAPPLDTLDVELTLRCPLRCRHCSAFASPGRREELPADALIAALAHHGRFREIYLSGGEPFVHSAFTDVVAGARKHTGVLVAYSSGTSDRAGLGPLSASILAAAKNAGLDRVDLSLYADTPAAHDALTKRTGGFAATTQTARRALDVGLRFGVHTVAQGVDAGARLRALASFSRDLGAERFHVLALADQGRAKRAALQPDSSVFEALQRLQVEYPTWVVLSRGLRRALGDLVETPRDRWRSGFLHVDGRLSPGEGHRETVTVDSILSGVSLRQLVEALPWPDLTEPTTDPDPNAARAGPRAVAGRDREPRQ